VFDGEACNNDARDEDPPISESEDKEFEVQRMIMECFGRYNKNRTTTNDGPDNDEDAIYMEEEESEEVELRDILEESKFPLYEGSKTSRLAAVLLLLNCFTVFGVSNACASEILKVVSELLPPDNTLPNSHYKAKQFLRHLGLSYNSIHTCRNGCCLFRQELADAMSCPNCGELRYTSESSRRPVKVLRHFPLIPRLQRIFRCARLADLIKWHGGRKDV